MTETSSDLLDNMRAAMRRLAASVTIVSAKVADTRYAMTATAVTSLSFDPPSLLICVNSTASIHDALTPNTPFCINILRQGQDDISNLCAGGADGEARFVKGNWQDRDGIPFLDDAQASLFCTVAKAVAHGSHTIVIGDVTHIKVSDDVDPLLYVDGGYASYKK